jgi:integrase
MLITDGSSRLIFRGEAGQARRRVVQRAVEEGRVRLVNGGNADRKLNVPRPSPRRTHRTASELDRRLEQWLADPTNRIPIRGADDPYGGPAGIPVWRLLERQVYGGGRQRGGQFLPRTAAGRRRRQLVERIAADGRIEIIGGRATHRERTIPCKGFAAVSRPDGTQAPWRTEITLEELGDELRMIRAACYVFVAALSLMRDPELQEIERGALTTYYGAPAVKSRKIKHDPAQPVLHWWIIEPVAEAIAVAERLSWHPTHLFAAGTDPLPIPRKAPAWGRRGIHAASSIDFFIRQANATRARTGLEEIPLTRVRPHMFRRTMAIIASQEPDSEIALGLQLKHAARRALSSSTRRLAAANSSWVSNSLAQAVSICE